MVISTAALYGWSNALRALTELIDVQGERLLDD